MHWSALCFAYGRMAPTRNYLLPSKDEKKIFFAASFYLFIITNLFFIQVQLTYSVVVVSAVQQSDSVIYESFFRFFSLTGHYKMLSRVPCRSLLFICFIHSSMCGCFHLSCHISVTHVNLPLLGSILVNYDLMVSAE